MSSPHSYTVVGGGAIGGTIAFHLAKAGHPVLVVDVDPAHVAAVRGSGLTIRRADGQEDSQRVQARTPEEVGGSLHAVVLAVKARGELDRASAGGGRVCGEPAERPERAGDRRRRRRFAYGLGVRESLCRPGGARGDR